MTVDNELWFYKSCQYYEIGFILSTLDPLNNISYSFLTLTFINLAVGKSFKNVCILLPSIFSGNDGAEGIIYSGRTRELNKIINSAA